MGEKKSGAWVRPSYSSLVKSSSKNKGKKGTPAQQTASKFAVSLHPYQGKIVLPSTNQTPKRMGVLCPETEGRN